MAVESERENPDWVSSPGETLVGQLRRRRVPAAIVGAALDGGMDQLRGLLDGSVPIDASVAHVLASTVGGAPAFWLRRQVGFDDALARLEAGMPEAERDEWLSRVPAPARPTFGRPGARRRSEELRLRMAFYGAGSLREWERRYADSGGGTRFRTSRAYASRGGPVALWLRAGELAAALVDATPFDRERLLAAVQQVRSLSRHRQLDRCIPALRDIMARSGVALVVRSAPEGCRASGATRMIGPEKAMLLLSLRHRSDDHLWFTVLHEIGHLVLHAGGTFVDGEDTPRDAREVEADRFAGEAIVPPAREAELLQLRGRHREVTRFAVALGVSPGLIVGQLQHRGLIGRDKLNFLKRRFEKAEAEAAAIL